MQKKDKRMVINAYTVLEIDIASRRSIRHTMVH